MSEDYDAGQKYAALTSAPFSIADAFALKAIFAGEATPEQQRAGLLWIVKIGGRLNRMSFQPESDRATAFCEGRRFVANLVMRLVHTNPEALKTELDQLKRKRKTNG